MPAGHLKLDGIDFVQLPPLRSDGASFTSLLDIEGNAVTPELMRERIGVVEQTLLDSPPDVLVTELFPFGRRILRDEFLAALRTAESLPRKPLVLVVRPRHPCPAFQRTEGRADAKPGCAITSTPFWCIPIRAWCRSKRVGR